MRKKSLVLVAGAFAVVGACSKTDNGDVVVKTPVVDVGTHTDTLHPARLTSKLDTINTPVMGTQKETVVVNRPVMGTKRTVVRVPVIQKP